jgi:hypothetical protein
VDSLTRQSTKSGHFHAVRFYENKASLCRIVAQFLSEGFVTGQPAIVISTAEHRDAIVQELRLARVDVDGLQASGDLLLLDAREALGTFMVDGTPDPGRFEASMTGAIDAVCRGRSDCTIRLYGEMVDLLWKDGLTVAAVQLEMLWNRLAMTRDFSLLCGYGMGNFYKDAAMEEICDQHSHVVSVDGAAAPVSRSPSSLTVN